MPWCMERYTCVHVVSVLGRQVKRVVRLHSNDVVDTAVTVRLLLLSPVYNLRCLTSFHRGSMERWCTFWASVLVM